MVVRHLVAVAASHHVVVRHRVVDRVVALVAHRVAAAVAFRHVAAAAGVVAVAAEGAAGAEVSYSFFCVCILVHIESFS